ncbi:MAG: hypothetical protein H7062_24300 [Candidatus Saccharimonas sp.]|nr:hypothetical protein [Planctomycetaceae bacterium]
MSRKPLDLARKITDILSHVGDLPAEADAPLAHYDRTASDLWNLLDYVEKVFGMAAPRLYGTATQRHRERLHGMLLVNFIECFERFLKEIAAACVDRLAPYVLDDRFDEFQVRGSAVASHFGAATVGRALCESSTWLDCNEVNGRFRKLLAEPFGDGGTVFNLFPKANQSPEAERWRTTVLSLVWQLRHTMVHNVGVITKSDAIKLRLLARVPVDGPKVVLPTKDDVRYLKRFLDETSISCNRRVGIRLAELLTKLHVASPGLFDPSEVANAISRTFGQPLVVNGVTGVLPAP